VVGHTDSCLLEAVVSGGNLCSGLVTKASIWLEQDVVLVVLSTITIPLATLDQVRFLHMSHLCISSQDP
jgi:hypothetical protein